MRILFVSHHAELIGGGELSQSQLLQALYAFGEKVVLAVPREGWCEQQARNCAVPVLHLPMPSIGLFSLIPTLRCWLKAISGTKKPDIIHTNTSRSCFYAGLIGRILGIPVVFHCRIADSDPKLDWMLARLVDCVVANSNTTAKRFSRWKSLDVRTVYNGIDVKNPEVTHPRPFGARLILLCVARVSRWKRHMLVLQTFERLAQDIDGLHLVCVGAADSYEPDWWDELQKYTQQLAISERIHWVGEQEDMTAWYSGADVLFLASEREPFGRVVVEAMGHGLPVVAFNKGGPSEIITNNVQGILLDEHDDFARKLMSLFTNEQLRKNMGQAGRRRAADFSLNQHVCSMQKVFRDVMKQEDI